MIYSRIIGTGGYLPEKVVTNDDLARSVETSDEWIRSRTGIRQRHIAAITQPLSRLDWSLGSRRSQKMPHLFLKLIGVGIFPCGPRPEFLP